MSGPLQATSDNEWGAAGPRRAAGWSTLIPTATYRIQLHKDFPFEAACRIVPYLSKLGVSHLYCSPVQRARPGSQHGYDVVAHDEINPELGGAAGLEALSNVLRSHGMGMLLDIVPNHMGVGADNPWWTDVLEKGQASAYSRYFDIDWHPLNPELTGKILLPVLGDHYGEVLERGELVLRIGRNGRLVVAYFDQTFPVSAPACAAVLKEAVRGAPASAARQALEAVAAGLDRTGGTAGDARLTGDAHQRAAAIDAFGGALGELLAKSHDAGALLASAISRINTESSRAMLDALLDQQHYRLAFWRVAADEINYRRFFDVNELAALRMEDPEVFERTHALPLQLAAHGIVDGLRVDHPDGLRDPGEYFRRLQEGYAQRLPSQTSQSEPVSRPLYVVAEKIAASGEEVPADWPIHGTTGYRFANVVNGVFIDPTSEAAFLETWQEFTGATQPFQEVAREGKRGIIRSGLSSELNTLSTELVRIARAHRRSRDYTLNVIRRALAEIAACMPVYRTYVIDDPSAQDRRFIEEAVKHARSGSDEPDTSVFDFVQQTLLGEAIAGADAPLQGRVKEFAVRFQQFTAPVAAKGVEDTAFYRYFPLLSLNEVGGEPSKFGFTVSEFHDASLDRSIRWAHTMLASSTHDNKRSEDVRNRINVLSEIPPRWAITVRRWSEMNKTYRTPAEGGQLVPTQADEYLLYQTLVGTLPTGMLSSGQLRDFTQRIQTYMRKAVREAKTHSSWSSPNETYERGLERFIDQLLSPERDNAFLTELQGFVQALSVAGALNGVSLMLIKLTSPGVPDIYQGTELIDLSMVDPDNRRAVDYGLRSSALADIDRSVSQHGVRATAAALIANVEDGRVKLWTARQVLAHRMDHPAFYADASYFALEALGKWSKHVVAYARCSAAGTLVVLAARFFTHLREFGHDVGAYPASSFAGWDDTTVRVSLPEGTELNDLLSGETFRVSEGKLELSKALSLLPGAALWTRATLVDPIAALQARR